ncbi:hypothetical protein MSG28_003037 [Choristoneura fumiferana]|uniref:Uncharacterized protein n=1 Tax=Choristoneura fumiferana TaxID=7141 RepID=A0ACC0JKG2_CHOFU|nr:hypothetical protein MSG28_003037 [Choristoneura fumiferana]
MTQAREPLSIMDGNPPSCDFSTKTKRGVYISKSLAFVILVIFVLALVATSFIVYNFAACPRTDQLANVTKYELSHCDQSKLTVLPLPTENSKSVIPLEVTSAPEVTDEEEPTVQDVRLPTNVKPQKYFLKLVPYIYEGNFTFDGEISIILIVKNDTQLLTFHAVDLTFHDIKLYQKDDGRILRIVKRTEDVPRQFQILTLSETLKTGKRYVLNATYTGILNDNLHGFYRSSYDEKNVKSGTLRNYAWDHYAESLPMSTYLVAFAVTDFGKKSDKNFTVWARKEALQSASYALDIGPKILKYLEEYYKIKFPLPKIDMIALPDFKAGAMENWGLLTFREIAMLYDSGNSPTTAKARVASVVAHEIAHQWFGNLVEKTWKLMEVFVLNEVQSVFKLDALTSSHQISVEVGNPEEIGAIFDKISYGKGSAILRMMNHFLTDDVFNAGITDYLTAKMYGDAEQRDLWSALTAAARRKDAFDADVAVVMDSWTLQTGFPVLTITRDYSSGAVTFKQERFVLINNNETKESPVWWIPVSYTTASENDFNSTRPKLWLRGERSKVVRNISVGKDDWLIANIQQTGFYRINYDQRNWQMLIKILNDPSRFEKIHPINRAQIVDDAMNLALSGRLDYKTALDIINYLAHETSYVPWKAGLVALGYIDTMLSKGAYYLEYKLKRFVAEYCPELGRPVQQVLERTEANVQWMERNYQPIMAALKLLVLALACYCASSFPQDQPKQRNTIFGDEKLQGEIFENLKDMVAFDDTVDPALYRLPTTTKPIHYNILWGVDFTSTPQAFSGTVEIQLQATQAGVSEIVIQSEELTIGTVSLLQGTTNIPVTYELEPDFQFMRINLTTGTLNYNAQTPVVYSLTISFAAPLRNDMYGIYRSWFRNQHNDTISWMATTQFQATSARKAFPCYDEPSFKATFDITISRPAAYYSWSCTRIASTVPTPNTPNYENDIYHRTPIMSTYLLALIVAEYDSLPILNEQGQLIYEVIARPNAISTGQGQYALEVGQDLLAEMNNHTDYNFYNMNPELKMTQASIPDFSAGAMENWGLLTYREAYIMYDPVHTNGYFKQLIAYILSHEIAHMWFGNLVETDMGLETRFITEQVHTALLSDSANNPYPLTNPGVGSPSAVSAMFSTLSYNKGAAVIRMTEHLLGHEVHRQGLRDYLVKHQFETVLPIDLFESLEAAGVEAGALAEYGPNFSLIDYYKSWTEQRGHPVLEVQVNHQTVATNWIIPITFSSASNLDFDNTKPTHVISKAITVINRGSIGDEWVIFNKQQTGYYRVNYDDYTWDLITAALRGPARTQIHEYNRAQIVNDVFQFARAGIMSYTKALNILSFLEFETSYAPWVAAMTGFTWLRNRLTGTQFLVPLETLISQWATVVMRDLTYYPRVNPENPEEPEDFMRSYLRYQLAPVMCQINRDNCRAEAVTQFNALRDQDEEVPADSRNWVYCNALREGTIQEFNFLRTRFLEHNDYTVAFNSAVTGNEENTQIVFSWIQNNFALVNNAFNNIATPLSYISSRLRNEAEVTNVSRWVSLFLGLALVQGILTASPIPTADEEWESFATMLSDPAYRLPTTTRPRHYVVSLTPYFETAPAGLTPFSFTGDVTIYMQPTTWFANQIVLHCNDLTIQSLTVSYTDTSGVTHEIAAPNQEFTCVMPYSFLYIQTTEMMWASQEYVIRASFTGNLQENMRGFYRSWYVDSTGNKRWMATTQFQPGHARQAFPCYDEPGFKATFDITMNREANFSETIGNMPIRVSTPLENGRIADVFYTTPYTSTYLLAFIVSHYIRVETNGNTVRPFDIYARDNVGTTGQWALEIGEQLLEKMEEYTDFPYYSMAENLNMKQAAIPDFSAGAMENWGLLTYREALILYDPLNSNHFYKQRVANIVAHEIAHMWIGNLVTCAWWDNLWLNEGFARFYQYFLTEMVRPDLGYSTRFIIEQVHVSMISDSIDSAHALTNPAVTDPVSVSNHFSTITYARGASVVRMTQAFNVAEPIHLFTAFDEAAAEDGALAAYNGITIEEYFKTWSEQPGHPLLHVEINHRTGEMIVTQSRWERNTGQSSLPSLYHVPITWTRAGDIDFDDLKPTQILTAQSTSINRGTEGLEWIVDDALQLARAGVLRYERAFNIISFLRNEDQYAPWLAAITGFNWVIRRLAHDDDNLVKLRTVINDLSIAATTRLGFAEIADESYMDGLMRMYLNTFLCNNGHAQCVTAAITNFNNWLNGVFIPANMRPWVYCTGLRLGSAANFDTFWDRYLAEDLASEKVVMLEAAGCTNNQASLEKYLTAIVSGDDSVRSQDFTAALNSAVSGNEANTMRAFYWLRNNVAQTIETLGSASTLISYITARLLNEQQIAEVQAWLDAERAVIGESAYNTGVAGIASTRNFLAWADVRTVELSTFFETGYIEEEIVLPELEPEPEPEPELQPEPEPAPTPSPDSANIAALSAATLLVTLAFNMMA